MDLLFLKYPEASNYTRPVRVQKSQPIPNVFLKSLGWFAQHFALKLNFFGCGFPDVFVLGYDICYYFDSNMKKSMKGAPDHLLAGCMTSLQQRHFRLLARVQEVS